jgi:Fic family protein
LGFDHNKVSKNNWYTNICSSVHELFIMKKEHMKSIKKELGTLEDYDGGVNQKSTSFSIGKSHRSWGVSPQTLSRALNTGAD